jgi:transposase
LALEIAELDRRIKTILDDVAAPLIAVHGVGYDTAGQLLVTAGGNPDRLRHERSYAALCGSSPVQVSSGKTDRHRLNRGGDRHANSALWRIVIVRMTSHEPTKDYIARRTAQGRTKQEIIRCLKRYIARELFAPHQQRDHTHRPRTRANRPSDRCLTPRGASPRGESPRRPRTLGL